MSVISHPWYKKRGYIHFDLPVGIKQAEAIVTSPEKVIRHSFYPFISYEIEGKKVRKSEDGYLSIKKKARPISYASHVDSHIYTYYARLLNEEYEKFIITSEIDNSVLAFRKIGKSNIDFADNAFNEIIKRGFCAAIALDIRGFFDNMDHGILKESWCRLLDTEKLPDDHYNVFRSLTKFSSVSKRCLYKTFGISKNNYKNDRLRVCQPRQFREVVRRNGMINVNNTRKGIPQGSPISALLSNIYMSRFDETVSSVMQDIGGSYMRYCDDILFIVPLGRKDEIVELAGREISRLRLELNTDKTKTSEYRIVHGQLKCDKPLQYLGFTFDGRHKLIRSAALARFSERMKSGVKLAKLTRDKRNKIRIRKGQPLQELYRKKIYERYSHLGRRNFVKYGFRSADMMRSNAIRRQLKPLWARLTDEIEK
jgi:hypothetical protein